VTRTYIYQLLDEGPDPTHKLPEQHYGLFRSDHSPKPAAVAVHNVTSFLSSLPPADPQARPPAQVPVRIAEDKDVNRLLIMGGKNVVVVALWSNDPYWAWDRNGAGPAPRRARQITIELASEARRARQYDPLDGRSVALELRGRTLQVPVEDHPTLLELQF
jgi:hypothetical protein